MTFYDEDGNTIARERVESREGKDVIEALDEVTKTMSGIISAIESLHGKYGALKKRIRQLELRS